MKVEIVPEGDEGKHCCTITLSKAFRMMPSPVQGQATDTSFVRATGYTPEHALNEAYKQLGQSVVLAMRNGHYSLEKASKEAKDDPAD